MFGWTSRLRFASVSGCAPSRRWAQSTLLACRPTLERLFPNHQLTRVGRHVSVGNFSLGVDRSGKADLTPPVASFREQVARGARVKPFSERIDRAGLISGLVVSRILSYFSLHGITALLWIVARPRLQAEPDDASDNDELT